jgi:hypothetical protein
MTNIHRRLSMRLGAIVLLATLLAGAVPAAAASTLAGHFEGNAYGSWANAVSGDVAVRLGRSAFLRCPCTGTDGLQISNTTHSVRSGQAFSADSLISTGKADKSNDARAYVTMTNKVTNVRALGGLVTADSIKAVATTRATAGGFDTTAFGSKFVDLRIAGQQVTVRTNQRINIPGFGYARIRNISHHGDGTTRRGIRVDMLRIVITRENDLDLPIGTVMVVGHAQSTYDRNEPVGLVSGSVYASGAVSTSGTVVNRFGRSAAEYLGCFSAGTITRTNNVDSLSVTGVLFSGTARTRLDGVVTANVARGRGLSRIEDLNLLDGLITADTIKGVVETKRTSDGTRTVSYAGSEFVNLRVAGMAIGDEVGPNTKVSVPGVGYAIFFETQTKKGPDRVAGKVIMVHLHVTKNNTFDLPVGTDLRLAYARTVVETP